MQSTKFTPGPWHVRTFDGSQWSIDDSDHNTVAQAQQNVPCSVDRYQKERTANARLIAAAPELLEALQKLVADFESEIHNEYDGTSMLEQRLAECDYARAAIDKATGNKA